MKVVILAGGFGTRISEESHLKPKPMIEIGERPILWHIMKIYSNYGFNDFIVCLGYKGYCIKDYFAHYFLHESDVTFDFRNSEQQTVHSQHAEPWRVTLVNTGINTMTGGRIKRVQPYIGDEPFMLTYGDGVSDININELVNFHHSHGKYVTVTATKPGAKFGIMDLGDSNRVLGFREKSKNDGNWVNSGFFVLQSEVFKYLHDDSTVWEIKPMETIAQDGQLIAYKHEGFWHPMDTLRDKYYLEDLWQTGKAPWQTWND